MDNVTSITDAPLTRRQAREIERRTGIRPIAGQSVKAEGEAFRHDTGEIKRNDVAALVSVLPTELISAVSDVEVPEAAEAEVAETATGERSLTVRATVPAALVAQRRRRTIGSFAAAASVAAAATVGMGSLSATADDHDVADKHLASLAAAVNGGGAQLPEKSAKSDVVTAAAAAPVKITADNTSVTAISADELSSSTEATEVVVEEPVESTEATAAASDDEGSAEAAPAADAPQRTVPAGDHSAALAAAAYNQVGITQDCTDAVQNALAEIGLTTRRDQGGYDMGIESFTQFGTPVSPDQAQPGDIMISYGYHVAIYLGDNTAMHGGWNGDADDTIITSQMGSPYDFDLIIRLN